MRMLGIDFGTSNTVAMLRTAEGRTRPLLFDGSPLLPSAVHLDAGGRPQVGRDAERAARLDPERVEPNPKRRIDEDAVLLGERELSVPRLIAAVLARVADEARRQLGAAVDQLRMTHPAGWGRRRRAVLVQAARAAGLPSPRLVAEPVAAAWYYTAVLGSAMPVGRALAVYDLGGGTFDASVLRRTPDGFQVLTEHGLPDLGGLDFDHAIVEHLGHTHAPAGDPGWARLLHPADPAARRQRALLYDDVRGAKETLSRASSTDVYLPALDMRAHLTRAELETLLRPLLAQTVGCLGRSVAAAGLEPARLVGIFLVGGSSRIPLAAQLIHTGLGVAPTTLEQPETVVAEGSLYLGAAGPSRPRPAGGASRPVPPAPAPPRRLGSAGELPPPVAEKRWYAEPVILGTVIVAVLVVAAFIILVVTVT